MRLNKKDYKEAIECLYNYRYNCKASKTLKLDIILSTNAHFDSPKAPYSISDPIYNTFSNIEKNEELRRINKQIAAIDNVRLLLSRDESIIFEYIFINRKSIYDAIEKLSISRRTYARRKQSLIYKTSIELKKLA